MTDTKPMTGEEAHGFFLNVACTAPIPWHYLTENQQGDWNALAAEISFAAVKAERTKVAKLWEALIDATASLTAAHSLLSRSPKSAAPSNKMFDHMLADYAASIGRARQALAEVEPTDDRIDVSAGFANR